MMLTGPTQNKSRNRRTSPRSFAVVTVVCLVLLLLMAVAQVAHTHPQVSDADHCPLCIVMHAAAPAAVVAIVILLIQVGTPATVLEPRAILRHWHPTLFTRPPPASF